MTSEELREARLRLGLTQQSLARLMGMPRQALNRIERGQRAPTMQQAAFMRYIEAHPPTAAELDAPDRRESR